MKSNSLEFSKSRVLRRKAHDLIPGGCHTYAKGDDQYPDMSPGFIVRGNGCHVWDVDGNEFIEYGMGLRAVTLGHAYEPVVEAAYRQMLLGTNYTRPSLVELECAEALLDLISGAEQVKFAKDGSTVLTAAVTLARAYTGRDMVAICAEHPFFSYNDWFIGTTEMSAGVPAAVRSLTVKFHYNDLESANTLFRKYPGKIACVVLEAARTDEPTDDFLPKLQSLCKKQGAVFILDEMITGFRWALGGAQQTYGIVPDLSAFGKAMANGYALSALAGKREIMELGGLKHNKERVFLLSTTHGAENHALAAALKTMDIYRTAAVVEYLYRQGRRLIDGVEQIIDELQLSEYFQLIGRPCNLVYVTRDQEQKPSQAFRTLFLQETIKRGIIAPSFVVSFSHTDEDIDHTIEATGEALLVYKKALAEGVERYLVGSSVKPVYRRFN
jgi:glutamate-1-semialdehyde 2,1-aminomutase